MKTPLLPGFAFDKYSPSAHILIMPLPGQCWYHVNFHTKGSWLPGDPRGWRSRHHKKHSSGDYKNPPPDGEHAGLYRYSQAIAKRCVTLPKAVRPLIGRAIVARLQKKGHRVLAVSVGGRHVHALAELPSDVNQAKRVIGGCKEESSRAVTDTLPGNIWAGGGKFEPVLDHEHQRRVYQYILDHAKEGAWVWSYRDDENMQKEA